MRKVLIILSPQALTLAPYVNMLMNGISALNATAGERGFQMMMADEAEGIQQQCEALQPDIIHLHGFGSAKANKAVVWAQKQGYRITEIIKRQKNWCQDHYKCVPNCSKYKRETS